MVNNTVRPRVDQLLDDLPQLVAAARVESGGGLVEEQYRWLGDQRTGQVEAAPHASRVGLHRPVAGIGEREALEQLACSDPRPLPAEVVEAADHVEVLVSGQVLVHRRVLARQADAPSDLGRRCGDVRARHRRVAAVGPEQCRQDGDGGRLAGSIGTEETEDGALAHGEVEAIEGDDIAVVFDESVGLDAAVDGVLVVVHASTVHHPGRGSAVAG